MKRKWLGLAWGLASFVPLVFISTPILAFQIGVVFLLCAMFLWPASWIANQFGVVPLTTPYAAIAAIYCGVIGAAIATMLPRLLNLPEQIGRGRAFALVALVWVPIGGFTASQILHYKGVLGSVASCPGHVYILKEHCGAITDFREQVLARFIDSSYLVTFRTAPGVLSTIAAANAIPQIDSASVPESFWNQPPLWWRADRSAATRVFKSPSFAFEGRGRDGDHYLLIEHGDENRVFLYFQSNF